MRGLNLTQALPPIARLAVQMHNRNDDDFIWKWSVYQAIRKPVQEVTSHPAAQAPPSFGVILDAGKRLAHFGGKLLPQPWRLRLVKGGCLIEFVFRLREKANDHGFRCLAKTSSASRAAVSPAK